MKFIGVDGCRFGWVSVGLSGDNGWAVVLDRTFREVVDRWREAEHIFVDIPVGLRDGGGERACDVAARAVLDGRKFSVFPAPVRTAMNARSHREASLLNREACGRGLSIQTWAIMTKIREVDELLRDDPLARMVVREVHPEVLFWGLTGSAMRFNKKKAPGKEERLVALERSFPAARHVFAYARQAFPRKLVADDDVIDAMTAAVVARLGRFRTLPVEPERDGAGLPMEMVYAEGG